MSTSSTRPRLAIVGGGGAMGRLFARILCRGAREIYLFDFFDSPTNPSSAAKVFDDLRFAGSAGRLQPSYFALEAGASGAWLPSPVPGVVGPGRWLMLLRPDDGRKPRKPLDSSEGRLSELVDRLGSDDPDGCTVLAAVPDDAKELLPRADLTVLAIGLEGRSSFAEAVTYYANWFRPGSLVVDLCSNKAEPMEFLCRAIDPTVGVLGAHPLFGPAVSDVTGLIVAVVDPSDGRPVSPWREWFLSRLAEQRLIVTPTTALEHDAAMSFVQALTHFTLLSFAYTFVRLDQDPAQLLAFRTPVFEPLLYLAARVAHLAKSNPDTYGSIQIHTTRPDVRTAFLEAGKEILNAIESGRSSGADAVLSASPDRLAELFAHYGSPWSPDRRDRRERQRREHFLEMGARLVDGLNRLREDVVSSAGRVRAVEEKRSGQPSRIVVGIVDLDLLDPGRQDIASRIRLRPVNLLLGSPRRGDDGEPDGTRDIVIPLARARVLDDAELFDWLLENGDLVESRSCEMFVPQWFDGEILRRLLKGFPNDASRDASKVWDVRLDPIAKGPETPPVPTGQQLARVAFSIVLHPAELVAMRHEAQQNGAADYDDRLRELDDAIQAIYRTTADGSEKSRLASTKDDLKRQRKKLIDQRTTTVDREVRRLTRVRVHQIYQDAVNWLYRRGCSAARSGDPGSLGAAPNPTFG